MSERLPLFMNQGEGFAEEMSQGDTATFGGLTLGGDIVMDGYKVTGLGKATQNGDALAYGQNDAYLGSNTYLNGGTTINGGLTMTSGNDIYVSGGGTLTGLPNTPAGGTDAVSKNYVDSVAQGLDVHPSCMLLQHTLDASLSGLAAIDGITPVDGYRILVTNESDGYDNGIWVAHAGAWTRPTDFANGYAANSSFVFIDAGTNYNSTGWVCTSDPPNDIVGYVDALTWSQFSGAGTYTAGAGITVSGGVISVHLGATNPGLSLAGNTLQAVVDGMRGMAKDGGGLYVKVDGTTMGFDLSGNLKALESEGAAAVSTSLQVLTGVHKGDPCFITSGGNHVDPSTTDDATAKVIGIAEETQLTGDGYVDVVSWGLCPGVLPAMTPAETVVPGTAYYLHAPHGLSTAMPGKGERVIQCGVALNATDLFVRVIDYGKKAA